MNLIARLARAAARVIRDVADAPAVARQLRTLRAQAETPRPTLERVPAPLTAEDIADELPEVADIEEAARIYEQARQDANAAARAKRKAEKVLRRTPDGVYGSVTVERFESSRRTVDLDAVRALFAAHGLGDVPMRPCSPSLVITLTEQATETSAPTLAAA